MTTRREMVKAGAGLAAIIAAGKAPAAFIRSMIGARNGLAVSGGAEPPTPGEYWGLCFTAEEMGDYGFASVQLLPYGDLSNLPLSIEASYDGENWIAFDPRAQPFASFKMYNIGDKVYFRAGTAGNTRTALNLSVYYYFSLSGKVAASGSIMSLLDGTNRHNTTLTTKNTFVRLFKECSNLTSAPDLPATGLAASCYQFMFQKCTGLTAAPILPAASLATNAYRSMFQDCSGITSAKISAQDASTATCMMQMFDNCSNLSNLEVAFSNFPSGTQLRYWVRGVAASGIFRCPTALGTNETIQRSTNACPSGWTVINTD